MAMEMRPVIALPDDLLDALEAAQAVNPGGAKAALLDVTKRLRTIALKSGDAGDFAPQRITQERGPTLVFAGRMLGEFSTARPGKDRWQEGEVWETSAGAWVAVLYGMSDVERERDKAAALVIEPGDDIEARRRAVMEHFGWTVPARQMARKVLRWSLEREVP